MKEVYIVAAKRTPIGSFGGMFSGTSAVQLGSSVTKSVVEESKINPEHIDEFFYGSVVQANLGQAPATQVTLGAGLSEKIPTTLINKVCASGMKATMLAAQSIQLGQNQVVISGGMENMSQIPFYLEKARYGYGYGNGQLIDGLAKDGLTDVYQQKAMGCFADATAEKFEISREEQDEYAINCYKKIAENTQNGNFAKEIASVEIKDRKGNVSLISEDEEYKKVNFDKIPGLKPAFTKEGTVTAANSSTINDGAASLILVSGEYLKANNLTPLAKIISYADASQAPEWFTTSPVIAAEKALKSANLSISDIDYFEVNEAFAVVAMAFAKHFNISHEKLNAFGGAVALGHPLGCSGARIIVTLINVLKSKSGKYGMAAICNGGGGASAIIIENQ
ncbi:MAG: acetyl-CoA C-acyltransferase [Cytophagaceae bacterium]|nr:acetyl-CoA C-acyltransferase [Cytophagaceae bacterium]MBK9936367.1 acetyl-CoA C-acyltransferase [Cytophagaceae bacterium]MBL0300114.1 acetyl-CoA C-acyltransferase [Cytophagaceae bacterium]MBL0327052.1 acetyl-CoA C-acyltransferase [Cytophagaceae bacterium]